MNKTTCRAFLVFLAVVLAFFSSVAWIDFHVSASTNVILGVGNETDVYTDNGKEVGSAYTTGECAGITNNLLMGTTAVNYIGGATADLGVDKQKAAVKFNITGVTGTVNNAALKIYVVDYTNSPTVNLISTANNSWSEGALSSTFPSYNAADIINGYSGVAISASGWKTFDVTSYLQSRVDSSATAISFVITGSEGANRYFDFVSDQEVTLTGNRPVLDITYTSDTTPPTVTITTGTTAGGDAIVNIAEKAAGFNVVAQSNEATGTLYVVSSGTASNIGAITGASIGSAASAGASTDTTIAISAGNAGVTNGTAYKVFAVDAAGNISTISGVAFTADLAAPTATITVGTTAGGDAIVNIAEKAAGFNVVAQSSEATGTLYVVPSGTSGNIGGITGATIGSAASAGASTDTTLAIPAGNAGVTNGTAYKVYAVDAAGNISTISGVAFTADLAAPTASVTTGTTAGGDAIVNIAEKAAGFNVVAQSNEATGTLYVVSSGTSGIIDDIASAAIGSAASAGASTDTTIAISAGNAGMTNGTSYKVYAVDEAENVSSISGIAFSVDIVLPTLSSAVKTNNTTITVTLSENCTNIAKMNDGGFVVCQTGTPTTTHAVTAIAQGADASHAVLTVADISASGVQGVTIKYTAAVNGIVQDIAGNAMSTNNAGVAIAAWSALPPASTPGPTPVPTPTPMPAMVILVNGEEEKAATSDVATSGGIMTTTVSIDEGLLLQILNNQGNNSTVTIPVNNHSDIVVGQLTGQTVHDMEQREAVLEIQTGNVTYTLPASQINIDAVSEKIGSSVSLNNIIVSVSIASPSEDTARIVQDTANRNRYQLVVKPVEFTITCTSGSSTVEVSRFNGYVERTVAIPDGIDPSKITTGIVLNTDGTFSHVPTTIVIINGKYYARINSLTNSTYTVISNPITFEDTASHWAKAFVNDAGSRLIVSGVGANVFAPDQVMTRAEFASVMVKALGLMRSDAGTGKFEDVLADDWFYDGVGIAAEYKLVFGYPDGNYNPNKAISRQEAMTMTARAMKVTRKINISITEQQMTQVPAKFSDAAKVVFWAREGVALCIMEGIVLGNKGKINPDNNITRAEATTIVMRMLEKAGLITESASNTK